MKKLFPLALPLAILFAYAGLVKGLDTQLFQTQLSKSPLIPPVAIQFISYIVPMAEIVIAIGFFSDRFFKWSAYASLGLMAFFSLYLGALISLFPADAIPCSCGGVLGKMSYPVHIGFNVIFTMLAGYICWQMQKISVPREHLAAHE